VIRFDRSRVRAGPGRDRILDLLERGFEAIDPGRCVREALCLDGERLTIGSEAFDLSGRRVWAIAIGKAVASMFEAVSERLGSALRGGIAVTRYGHGASTGAGVRVLEAGHPIPDESGAAAIVELTHTIESDDLVLCLLSGGGAALLAAPPPGVSLEDLAETTRLLLRSGAAIDEVNTVRRHLSTLQGGRLAYCLHPATVVTLVLSDVIGDSLEAIASGPTVPDPTTYADAIDVLRRHSLWKRVPLSVLGHLSAGAASWVAEEAPKPDDPVFRGAVVEVIGSNAAFLDAVERAAQDDDCDVVRAPGPAVGEARDVGRELARRVGALARGGARRTLWVAGGETTVTIRGRGRGGRNQELALAAALEIDGLDGVCVAALATDGSDGVTNAAGGIGDGTTADSIRGAGLDPIEVLEDNDSHVALEASGDLLYTGPTRTNVADVYVALIDGS